MTTLKQARIRTRLRQETAFRKAVARKSFFKAERQKAPRGGASFRLAKPLFPQ